LDATLLDLTVGRRDLTDGTHKDVIERVRVRRTNSPEIFMNALDRHRILRIGTATWTPTCFASIASETRAATRPRVPRNFLQPSTPEARTRTGTHEAISYAHEAIRARAGPVQYDAS
jgi:hypothetical protein